MPGRTPRRPASPSSPSSTTRSTGPSDRSPFLLEIAGDGSWIGIVDARPDERAEELLREGLGRYPAGQGHQRSRALRRLLIGGAVVHCQVPYPGPPSRLG